MIPVPRARLWGKGQRRWVLAQVCLICVYSLELAVQDGEGVGEEGGKTEGGC